ncbi:MAG: hypothetical protein JO112_11960, partial [Planctomycetes bacterium]|nr:hypothetical protein [Planctomycetota bacterium]
MQIYLTILGLLAGALAAGAENPAGKDATLRVDAGQVVNHVTRLMYGACIEDVNHEIYGGLYAQMIFGASFEEPPRASVPGLSGMWDPVATGTAVPGFTWEDGTSF